MTEQHRMVVESPRRDGKKILASLNSSSAGEFTLMHKIAEQQPHLTPDPFLIAGVLPAMTLGGVLETYDPVSPRLMRAIPRIQDILLAFDRHEWSERYPDRPRLKRVEVSGPIREASEPNRSLGAASFFTGGVDSFYTALKHSDEIEALIYVRGFDLDLRDEEIRRQTMDNLREAASELGKRLIAFRSNLRKISDQFTPWGPYHGEALASAAVVFAGQFSRVYIPSSFNYAHLPPWGSHPLLDPLWSTEEVEIVHDGCEVSRTEKLQRIAGDEVAQSRVRVCFERPAGALNCGRCEKCLRTMVALRTVGVLDLFTAFPELDVADMAFCASPHIPQDVWRWSWGELLANVRRAGEDPDLEAGIQKVLSQDPRQWPEQSVPGAEPGLGLNK